MNAKQRYNARRAAEHREKKQYAGKINRAFAKLSGEGCERVVKALSSTEYKMNMRVKPEIDAVTRECAEYRKVRNPLGQQINARQKMRGKSIPLI